MRGRFSKVFLAGTLSLSVAAACGSGVERPASNNASVLLDPVQRVGVSVSGNYLAGRQAAKRNDFYQASKFLENGLQTSPDSTFLISRTFTSKLAMGDVEGAYRLVTKLVRSDISNPIIQLLIVVEAIKRNRLKDAQETIELIPEEGLNRFLKPLLKAWVFAGQGHRVTAVKALDPLKKHPELRPLYENQVALVLDALGVVDTAETHYRLAAKFSGQPSMRIIQGLGRYFERTGRSKQAQKLYIKYLKANPNSVVLQRALSRLKTTAKPPMLVANVQEGAAEALFSIASMIPQERSTRLALIYARLATYLRYDLDVGYMLIARFLEVMARYDDAITTYRKIRERSPLNWDARLRIAENLQSLDRDEEAIVLLKKMATEKVGNVTPLIILGDLFRSNKKFLEAISAYNSALKSLDNEEKRHWVIHYSRGIALERSRQWDLAERDLQKALKLNPDQPYVLNYLGYSWVDQGKNLVRARKMIERAVELRPNDGYIVDSLGWLLYRLKNYKSAVSHLERAAELRPQDPTINDHLGDAYWQMGRFSEARFQWKRALLWMPEPGKISVIEGKILRGLRKNTNTENDG